MRVTTKGQVTIPQSLRERYWLMPETELEFVERDGALVIQAATGDKPDRGQQLVTLMRGSGNGRLTADEIMKLTRDWEPITQFR